MALRRNMLNQLRKTTWIVQSGITTPHMNSLAAQSLTTRLHELSNGLGLRCILTFFAHEGDDAQWALDKDSAIGSGRILEKDPARYYALFEQWKIAVKNYYVCTEPFLRRGIHAITGLKKQYASFIEAYTTEYGYALVTEHLTAAYGDSIFTNILKKVPPEKSELCRVLTSSSTVSFHGEEELSLLKIGLEFKRAGKINQADLHRHQQSFFWINNNYKYTTPLSEKAFAQRVEEAVAQLTIGEIQKKIQSLACYEEEIKRRKEKAQKELSLSAEDERRLELLSFNTCWHDQRKKANLIANYIIGLFIEKAAEMHRQNPLDLKFVLYHEFARFLETGALPSDLEERKKECVEVDISDGRCEIYTGREYLSIKKMVLEKDTPTTITELRGLTASPGTTTGTVRVALNPRTCALQTGEILVTSMTRPDFVPLMKKAKAIITNEGGVTSHAAIISREMGIPCIVGTKVATQVLKTGDTVQILGDTGVIKIVKRST